MVIDDTIATLTEAWASKKSDCSTLTLRTDNGSQYISVKFDSAVKTYGVKQEFVHYHTSEQNDHVESFHKSFKKEYV